MAISILNNIASLAAQNQLAVTQNNLNKTLFQLSSGSRINSGADDAAGLAIADGLHANITALTQSVQNSNSGVGALQVADGSLAQVTQLLNRAVTLATESANGTVSDSQRTALQAEYAQINAEIDSIGSSTNYNGSAVFSAAATNIFLSDGVSNTTIGVTTGTLSTAGLGLAAGTVNIATAATYATAQATLTGQPVAGDQVDINGQTYTFQDVGSGGVAAAGDVLIGATTGATVLNLAHAVNNSGGTSGAGNDYLAAGGAANTSASATVLGNTITLTALTTGTGGNAYTLTSPVDTSGNITITAPGGVFTGGAAATSTPTAVTNSLSTAAEAQLTLGLINTAIASVASTRGTVGANINRLQAASNVITNQTQNLTAAEDGIRAADIPSVVANLSRYTILNQSGISALAQANSAQQSILTLLR
ncbi:MAG: flagellin [Acidobacteriia bacterium]|nr:flagellin [Terriglobia bacterium]